MKTSMKSLNLPKPIATYFAADKNDSETLSQCFTENAVVKDEGHTYRAAILRLAATGAVRREAFPDRLSIELAERDHRRLLSAGGADHFVAVNERRFPKTPHRASSAEVRHQVSLPNDLPVRGLKASDVACEPHHIKAVPV